LLQFARELKRSRRLPIFMALVFVAALALLSPRAGFAQNSKPSEYDVKAAYLFNFGKFVKWPAGYTPNQGEAFTICALGNDQFETVLQSALAGKTMGGTPVAFKQLAKPQDAASCRVLFIDGDQERNLKGILAALDRDSVLTVSDISDFSKRGGMIEFVTEGNRVRFAINRTVAENAGLVLESDLLKVATTVRDSGHPGGP
jgi:hypothetical protein